MHIRTSFEMAGFAVSARTPPKELGGTPLMKSLETFGRFWLPDSPENRVGGNLNYAPGRGIRIVTQGSFFGPRYANSREEKAVLHGQLINGAPCTVFDASMYENGYLSDGPTDHLWLDILGTTLVIGVHAASADDLLLSEMTVQFSHLDHWLKNPFEVETKPGNPLVSTVADIFKEIELPFSHDGRHLNVTLECVRTLPFSIRPSDVSWSFTHQLRLAPEGPAPMDWFLGAVGSLRRLFTFLIGSGVYTLKLEGKIQVESKLRPVHLYPTVTVPSSIRIEDRYFHCKFGDLQDSFSNVVAAWAEQSQKLDTVTRGVQELCTIDGISPEGLFLVVTQLLEHFDGVLHPNESHVLPKEAWGDFLTWLRHCRLTGDLSQLVTNAALTDVQEQIICQRLAGVNRISFRSRLLRLFTNVPVGTILHILGNPGNHVSYTTEMLKRVQRTRDYLTHLGGKKPKDAFSGEEMWKATTRCWCVLIYWLARSLGLSEKLCDDFAYNARYALFLVSGSKEL